MPQYDFHCAGCDGVFSLERPLGHLDSESCPTCGAEARRVFEVFEKQPSIGGGSCACDSDSCSEDKFDQLVKDF